MIQSNIYPRDEGFVAGSYLASQETKGKPEKKGGKRKLKKKDDVLTNEFISANCKAPSDLGGIY